jgi:hypothetical protein
MLWPFFVPAWVPWLVVVSLAAQHRSNKRLLGFKGWPESAKKPNYRAAQMSA